MRSDWSRLEPSVSGPLATLVFAVLLDQLARHGLLAFNPLPLLLLVVAGAGLRGGTAPGLIAGIVAALYATHFYDEPFAGLQYTPDNARSLILVTIASPLLGAITGYAARGAAALRGSTDAEELDAERRLALPGEWAELLASSDDYRGTLQAVARRVVPALADWCTIHLAEDDPDDVGVAGVHHDAAREMFVQALRRYPPRGFPDAVPGAGEPRVHDWLTWARDDAHAKLLRALAPAAVLAVPLVAHGRTLGLLALGNDAGRGGFSPSAQAAAALCADLAAAAVERARLVRAGDALRAEHRFLFEEHSLPMWVIDAESLAFLAVNEAAVQRYGWSREEFLGMTLMDLRGDDATAPGSDSRPRRADVAVNQHRRKDGGRLDVEIVSRAVVWRGRRARLVVVQDVTDLLRAEAALRRSDEERRHAQRMDATGRLAGGVAHDFNNVLTTIQGYSELLLRSLGASDPRRDDLDAIRKAADRGAALSRQLLAFGERQRTEPRLVDLNATVTSMESLVQRLLGADVQLLTIRAPALGRIHIDPALLEQVLVSLVLNARDAMPRGGTLTVETAERRLGASGRGRNLQPGLYAVLAVSDTGGRLDGGGMELPTVYGIVRQAGGVVRVSGEPGEGTTVKAYFPIAPDAPVELAEPAAHAGDEMVLIVEDEEPVRDLLRKLLTNQGYRVLEARHGMDALRVLERHHGPLDLMITDVVMPELDGLELAARARVHRPDLPVLFISGYTSDEVMRRGADLPSGAFVHKPFASDDLLRAIRGLLDAAPETAA